MIPEVPPISELADLPILEEEASVEDASVEEPLIEDESPEPNVLIVDRLDALLEPIEDEIYTADDRVKAHLRKVASAISSLRETYTYVEKNKE